jgi:hypothetical protein
MLSGRCCRFREHGHTLFVSAPEIQFFLAGAPEPSRPLDQGDTCPWQDQIGRCTARASRPLGCRIYFCDPDYQIAAHELSERFLTRVKRLADIYELTWDYAPLHQHLREERGQGRLFLEPDALHPG